jgi:hypothetical protein
MLSLDSHGSILLLTPAAVKNNHIQLDRRTAVSGKLANDGSITQQ